jgi:hypothetical protein
MGPAVHLDMMKSNLTTVPHFDPPEDNEKPVVFNAKAQREMKAAKFVGKQLQEFSLRLGSQLCVFALNNF